MCFLRRVIYGLKWSPHAWFSKLSGLLSTFGFISCVADLIVLTKKTKDSLVIHTIYVDDILLTNSDDIGIYTTKTYLQKQLSIHDLGSSRYFIGIEFVHYDEKLTLTKQKYALDLTFGSSLAVLGYFISIP